MLVALCNNKWAWSGTFKQIVLLCFAFSFSLHCSMTLHKSPLTSYTANRLLLMRPKILGHFSDAHSVLWSQSFKAMPSLPLISWHTALRSFYFGLYANKQRHVTGKQMKDESLFMSMPKQIVVYPCSYHSMFNSSQIETRTLSRNHQTRLQIERANR